MILVFTWLYPRGSSAATQVDLVILRWLCDSAGPSGVQWASCVSVPRTHCPRFAWNCLKVDPRLANHVILLNNRHKTRSRSSQGGKPLAVMCRPQAEPTPALIEGLIFHAPAIDPERPFPSAVLKLYYFRNISTRSEVIILLTYSQAF